MKKTPAPAVHRTISAQQWFLACSVVAALGIVVAVWLFGGQPAATPQAQANQRPASGLDEIPFPGAAAFAWLERICALGPRVSGSEGMARQQQLLAAHFTELGGQVELQEFAVRHPQTGQRTELKNLIVRWHPQRKSRVLLCAHYDTRPFADRDPDPNNRRRPRISGGQ